MICKPFYKITDIVGRTMRQVGRGGLLLVAIMTFQSLYITLPRQQHALTHPTYSRFCRLVVDSEWVPLWKSLYCWWHRQFATEWITSSNAHRAHFSRCKQTNIDKAPGLAVIAVELLPFDMDCVASTIFELISACPRYSSSKVLHPSLIRYLHYLQCKVNSYQCCTSMFNAFRLSFSLSLNLFLGLCSRHIPAFSSP